MPPSCHSLRIELQIYLHEYCVSFSFLVGCKLTEGCLVCLFSFYFWSLHCAPPPHIPQRLLYKFTRTPFCHHCTVPSMISCEGRSWGCLSHVCHGARLSVSCVQGTGAWLLKHTRLWLPVPESCGLSRKDCMVALVPAWWAYLVKYPSGIASETTRSPVSSFF